MNQIHRYGEMQVINNTVFGLAFPHRWEDDSTGWVQFKCPWQIKMGYLGATARNNDLKELQLLGRKSVLTIKMLA